MLCVMSTFSSHRKSYWILLQVLIASTSVIHGNYADLSNGRSFKESKFISEDLASHQNYVKYNSQMDNMREFVNSGPNLLGTGNKPFEKEKSAKVICSSSSNKVNGLRKAFALNNVLSSDISGGARAYVPDFEKHIIVKRFQEAEFSVLLLDYDGTLVELVKDPAKAVPTSELEKALNKLDQKYPYTQVSIISGRKKDFLEKHLGHYKNILLSAEHGAFVRKPGENWLALSAPLEDKTAIEVRRLMEESVETIPGSYIESKITALVWHFKPAEDEEASEIEARNLVIRLQKSKLTDILQVQKGNKIVEVKVDTSKGEIAVGSCKAQSKASAVLVMGDDVGDEPMFEAVSEYAKRQGPEKFAALTTAIVHYDKKRETKAQVHIPNVKASVDLLQTIADLPPVKYKTNDS